MTRPDVRPDEPLRFGVFGAVSCLVDCGTGCRGYAYLYTADWLRTDPRCAKTDPRHPETPAFYPVCPIMKLNVRTGRLGGSTEQSLEASSAPAAPTN